MAELQPAHYTAGACHTAQGDRLVWSSIICTEGVSDKLGGDLLVSPGAAGLTVDVGGGSAFINGDNIADQGTYHVANLGDVTLVLGVSDPTDGRIDLVVATVRDAQYSGTDNDWVIQVIQGVTSPAPVAPGVPPNSIALAEVLVIAGATTPGQLVITDVRPQMALCGPLMPASVTNRDIQARMSRSSPAGLISGSTTNIPWNRTDYNAGMVTSGSGITVPIAGRYHVLFTVGIDNSTSTTGFLHLSVSVNASPVRVVFRGPWASNAPTVVSGSVTLQLNAGDVVSGGVFHNNGVQRNVGEISPNFYETFIEVDWVA